MRLRKRVKGKKRREDVKRQITKIERKGERESEKRWGRGKSKRKRKTERLKMRE